VYLLKGGIMANSKYWTLFETYTYAPNCAYSPEGQYAKNLLALNSNYSSVYNILDKAQRARLMAGKGPATGAVLQNITQTVSEIITCQAVKDIAKKKAYNDSLIGTKIQLPESVDLNGNPKPSRWTTFLEIGAIAVSIIATVHDFIDDKNTLLKNKMSQLGYVITSEVPNGWIFPDGVGCPMKDFMGGHKKMLYDMGIEGTGGYTDFEVAYLLNKLIRKASYTMYTVGSFTDSNVLYGLKYQILHDMDAGHIKSADRIMIENAISNKIFSPTLQELMDDGIRETLTRPMRDSATWQ
jgi:hypothetical protein